MMEETQLLDMLKETFMMDTTRYKIFFEKFLLNFERIVLILFSQNISQRKKIIKSKRSITSLLCLSW